MSNISLVIEREYRSRVIKKSFIITTLLMPLVMLIMMFAPAAMMIFTEPEHTMVSVIDDSHAIADRLVGNDNLQFLPCTAASVEQALAEKPDSPVLVIPGNVLESPNAQLRLYTTGPSSMKIEADINNQINDIIENVRLTNYGIHDIDKILNDVRSTLSVQVVRSDKDDDTTSSEFAYVLGTVLSLVLYMFMLLYGQMVMTSIIEEKNNRVLEVVVSSVKPVDIMMGKIIGIALVAVTQIVIWAILSFAMVTLLLPAIMPAEIMSDLAAVNAGNMSGVSAGADLSLLVAFSQLTNLTFLAGIFITMTLFLVGGFLLYSAIYAAIGSAVDNIQDASQLQIFTIVPIMLGLFCSMSVGVNPNSSLVMWCSFIPFTSPMVMMARLPFGIPVWQTVVSLVILTASFIAMTWVAAKIYRVGIFMYGKKPTARDLIRWINYK